MSGEVKKVGGYKGYDGIYCADVDYKTDKRTEKSRLKYEGSVLESKNFGFYKVLKYNSWSSVEIEFVGTGYRTFVNQCCINTGNIKDYMLPSVFGVGFLGGSEYNITNSPIAYSIWTDMIRRCYMEDKRFSNYIGHTVCEEWHNFQNFAKWCSLQNGFGDKDLKGKRFNLDKDLFSHGNLYSPQTCCFLPPSLNNMIKYFSVNSSYTVRLRNSGKWTPRCYRNGREVSLGTFSEKSYAVDKAKNFNRNKILEELGFYETNISEEVKEAFHLKLKEFYK